MSLTASGIENFKLESGGLCSSLVDSFVVFEYSSEVCASTGCIRVIPQVFDLWLSMPVFDLRLSMPVWLSTGMPVFDLRLEHASF